MRIYDTQTNKVSASIYLKNRLNCFLLGENYAYQAAEDDDEEDEFDEDDDGEMDDGTGAPFWEKDEDRLEEYRDEDDEDNADEDKEKEEDRSVDNDRVAKIVDDDDDDDEEEEEADDDQEEEEEQEVKRTTRSTRVIPRTSGTHEEPAKRRRK